MPIDQNKYAHAMAEDPETGKPMEKVAATLTGSTVAQPVDIQARLASTIQTISAQTVVNGAWHTPTTWAECDGFDEIGVTFSNSVAANSRVKVQWSNDGTNIHGEEEPLGMSAEQYRSSAIKSKARYFRYVIFNGHTAPITANAWAYLKA